MAAPSAPNNVNVQQGNGQVYLSWDITAGALTYPVARSTDGVTFTALAAPVVASYLDTTAVVGTTYYYQVQAANGDGSSTAVTTEGIVPSLSGNDCLGSLRLQAQQRADRVNSNFVTLPEWNSYINQSYFELYDLLVTVYEDYYMADVFTFQTNGTDSKYPLPNGVIPSLNESTPAKGMYKLQGVDLGIANNDNAWVTLKKFDFIQRNRYVYPSITSTFLGVFNMRYRVMGNNLLFIPTPAAGQYVRVWYVPRMERLLKDTDMADGVSGWTEYIIVDAAIKALEKEESDTSLLMAQKAALIDRINSSAMNRDIGQPDTISPTRRSDGGGNYGGPGFDGGFGGY